jgi:glycosyltransferase
MKVLVIAAGSPATVFALAPLATAVRNAGHQVFMAANDVVLPSVYGQGLPGVPITSVPIWDFISTDRDGNPIGPPQGAAAEKEFTGRWFARMALAHLVALRELARDWRPDVIVGGTMSYAAPLLAHELGVPFVRQAWDAIDATAVHPGAALELAPELAELGLSSLPEPALFVDVCPPSLRPAHAEPAQPMRWIPGNQQRELERWMYVAGPRPRICLTAGSRVSIGDAFGGVQFLRTQVKALQSVAGELIVAAPEPVADLLREEFPQLRAGWVPLDVVGPTCDLVVHNGGGTTTLTSLYTGVPQLILPKGALPGEGAAAVARYGAALAPGEDSIDVIESACAELTTDPGYRRRAAELADEMAAMPTPAQVADRLVQL